jgi:hypothetical protein
MKEMKGDGEMAFGINRKELIEWKTKAGNGEISFLTHYWLDDRFPDCNTVTKAACTDRKKLVQWGRSYGLRPEWIHDRDNLPHFDLLGEKQREILKKENKYYQLQKLEKRKKG